MRKLIVFVALVLLSFTHIWAGDGEYSVLKISPVLLKKANAVLRLEEIRFEISSTRETVLKNHYVITILNENGDDWAEFSEYYDKYQQIESVEGVLYDANGKQLKKIKKKDLEDLSGVSDGSLMDDNRIKRHNFYYKIYPYTIEYTIEINNKSTLFFPRWVPQGRERLSVEKSSISIACPAGYQFRYKAFNYDKEPVVTDEKNYKVSTWAATNMPAIERELYSPMWHELATMVIFGPTEFQVDDYKGNMASWQDFGKFVNSLRLGRDQLPENVKQAVHRIADDISNPIEKIARLYEYLQKNTRYISIQLGVGGWQPFDAKEVAAKGYGDCKALTNYMYSILKEAGITSYYTVVRGGKNANYITEDFPSQQFNHVILCAVLSKKDSVWLECTSQTMPAGYLGDFTSDRYALLIDDSGGKLVHTPKYGMKENLQTRSIRAKLEDNGTLTMNTDTRYTGIQQDALHGMINHLSKEKIKEHLQAQLDFSTYDIDRFDYKELKTSLPSITESLDITVSNYATITGKRLFILPNVMTRSGRKLSKDSTRKYDIQLGYEYKDVDSIEIELPKGYEPEAMPQPISVNSKFGNYSSSVKLKDSKLYYYRTMEHNCGRYPGKEYDDLVQFYDAIYKADRGRVVLVKNEVPLKAF
jgi:transglutaminase-like putative cysteine protease